MPDPKPLDLNAMLNLCEIEVCVNVPKERFVNHCRTLVAAVREQRVIIDAVADTPLRLEIALQANAGLATERDALQAELTDYRI